MHFINSSEFVLACAHLFVPLPRNDTLHTTDSAITMAQKLLRFCADLLQQ